jgi:uncharacterized protein (DUF927 family)
MSHSDFRTVAVAALSRFDAVANWLGIGGGKNQGREYLPINPTRADTKPGSFTINRDSGAWADFASGDKGGDLVSLVAYLHGIKQGEAADRLAEFLGIEKSDAPKRARNDERGAGNTKASTPSIKPASGPASGESGDTCIMPVPDDAPAPPASHMRHGKPSHRWAYLAADGRVNFYVDRWDATAERRKQFSPVTLRRTAAGKLEWRFKGPPAPQPLYGLPTLAKAEPVVIVEGEKAADAAAILLPDHPVVTWQGGAQAVAKAEFSPLASRECWLWADADEAGEQAMNKVAERLFQIGAASVKRFALNVFATIPSEHEGKAALTPGEPPQQGDDAADLVARGWTAAHMRIVLPAALVEIEPLAKVGAGGTATKPEPAGGEGAARRFELSDKGVHYFEPDKAPRWVCAWLEVAARVRNPHGEGWGKLVNFMDPDRTPKRRIIADMLLSGDGIELERTLRDAGLHISPTGRPLLRQYLIESAPKARARVTNRTGWHDDNAGGSVFVMPDQAIGGNGEQWIYENESPSSATFGTRGTLKGWQDEVAALCCGNSRLLFAVSVSFAAPLLYLVGADGGGFHVRGDSSGGKTTLLRVMSSVCGGREFLQAWRSTDNALESVALAHCDAPLPLDELAQMDPRAAGEVAYMLANGQQKNRAQRTGGLRARAAWRVLFLSAGEIGLAEHMGEIGKSPRAGQELRLAEVAADAGAGLGIFETLHGYATGAEFSKALTEAARRNYGGAFVAFLEKLARHQFEVADTVKEAQRKFQAAHLTDQAHGQARRVADRFALVGAAGELAQRWGIVPWEPGEAMKAARTCFDAWLARRGGEGNAEERAALRQVREFLRRYGESAFTDMDRPANDTDKHAPVRSDRAGYRRHDAVADAVEYFIFNEVWRTRVCKGFDAATVGRTMAARGFVERGTEAGREWLTRHAIPTEGRPRVVHVLPAIWDDDEGGGNVD